MNIGLENLVPFEREFQIVAHIAAQQSLRQTKRAVEIKAVLLAQRVIILAGQFANAVKQLTRLFLITLKRFGDRGVLAAHGVDLLFQRFALVQNRFEILFVFDIFRFGFERVVARLNVVKHLFVKLGLDHIVPIGFDLLQPRDDLFALRFGQQLLVFEQICGVGQLLSEVVEHIFCTFGFGRRRGRCRRRRGFGYFFRGGFALAFQHDPPRAKLLDHRFFVKNTRHIEVERDPINVDLIFHRVFAVGYFDTLDRQCERLK